MFSEKSAICAGHQGLELNFYETGCLKLRTVGQKDTKTQQVIPRSLQKHFRLIANYFAVPLQSQFSSETLITSFSSLKSVLKITGKKF